VIDFKKAFDKIDSNKLWNILYKCSYPPYFIETIKCLYNNNIIQIDTSRKISKEISVNHGVRWGYSLSPPLFKILIGNLLQTWKT
jgi:Reverse transcriptase (RNA-dependent DNA polymerase).